MNKKTLAVVGVVSAVFLLLPNNSYGSSVPMETLQYTQKLSVPSIELMDRIKLSASFNRGSYKIIETKPWLKQENRVKQLSEQQLTRVLQLAGFSGKQLEMAKAIVFLESTNRPYSFNRSSNCYGLFQINMSGSMGENRREKYGLSRNEDLYNPAINASIAYQMSNGGKDWSAWSTEKSAKKIVN